MIPFKAKAWLDLSKKTEVDSADVKKHRNDIIRLASELMMDKCVLPQEIRNDMKLFIEEFSVSEAELKSLKIRGVRPDDIKEVLINIYLG